MPTLLTVFVLFEKFSTLGFTRRGCYSTAHAAHEAAKRLKITHNSVVAKRSAVQLSGKMFLLEPTPTCFGDCSDR